MSDNELCQLIYLSRNTIAGTPEQVDDELTTLIRRSRARNSSRQITGALLMTPTNFAQVLEGPPEHVWALYQLICEDPRHDRVQTVVHEVIASRRFDRWTMGGVRPAQDVGEKLAELAADAHAAATADDNGVGVVGEQVRQLLAEHLTPMFCN